MKFVLRPQRRSATKEETRISLFPFLAVLICTMGALIPLLMVITFLARQQAQQATEAKIAERSADVETQTEDVRWRNEQLKLIREANEAELAETRLVLAHLEDHERRLREQLEAYKSKLEQFKQSDQSDSPKSDDIEAEMRRLQAEIDVAGRRLNEARRTAAARKPSYAIIPYDGPNQTRRRPIYIECRADTVVLQPEGIELTETDFDGPLGPSNPLAAALRAASEYIQSRPGYNYDSGVPYPMLLVRPDGVSAYYAARAAMTSWAADFGYELIGDDWQLAFQRSDPQLTETLRQVVASARVRQSRLAAAAPSHRGVSSKVVYRAAPSGGGFIREQVADDSGSGGYRPAGNGNGRGTGSRGSRRGGGWGKGREVAGGSAYPPRNSSSGATSGAAGSYGNTTGATAGSSSSAGDVSRKYTAGQASSGTPQYGSAYPNEHSASGGAGSGAGNYPQSGNSGGGGEYAPSNASSRYGENNPLRESQGGGNGGSSYSDNASAGGGSGERPEGYVAGQPPSEKAGSAQSSGGAGGQAMLPGQWIPSPLKQSGASGGGGPSNGGQPSGGQSSDGKGGTPGGSCQMSINMTEKRGKDWGLREASRGAVGLSRPIRVECHADRLVIHAERGLGGVKVVKLGPRIESSVNEVISSVWDQIDAWGIAGKNMYWRPVLKVTVAPGGERHFDELKAMLDGSGIAVEKK